MSETSAKRIEAKDLRAKERQPLQELIPLGAPFVVYVDPTNLRNFRCEFCPTSDKALLKQVGRPYATMSLETFDKVIEDLKAFGVKLKLASLYKDGEPTLNKHFPEMIARTRKAGVAERIWTKTNGSRLGPELNRRIVDAGLDMLCVSIEGTSAAKYAAIAGVKIDYDALREGVRDFYEHRGNCEVYVKIADSGLSEEEVSAFYRDFSGISTHIAVERLMGWSNSGLKDFTLGTQPTTYDGLPLVDKKVCAYPFYVMAVNADGSVSLCGNDWSHGTVVGDVHESSLKEIWEGEALRRFRVMHLEGRRGENAACGDCYYLRIVPDNLDPYAEALLARLRAPAPTGA